MRIKEIEIDNFKSFRSKTTIPFLEGFTTISGPNGSGKSNIIDCILFGLGLSTSRTLRAEKLTDLINNNNQRREASVKIIFEDDSDSSHTFEVKRKIKDGQNGYTSTYYLNGRVSTLTEIHDTLSRYNVAPGCYNVMMQGDVTGIINMSATERRKIIDELAGVTEFDRRIEQASKEIDTVQDRIERSNIILGEIDARIEQLSEQRDQALKYQKLQDERQSFINQISLVKYVEIRKSISLLQENINEANKEKGETETYIAEMDSKIAEAKQLLDELNQQVKIKGEDEYITLTRQSEALKGEIFRKEQSIEFSQKQIEENNKTIEKAYQEINKHNENVDDTKLKIESKQEQYGIIEKQLEKEQTELTRLIAETSDLTKTAQGFIEKRNQLRKDLEKAEDNHGRLIREKLKWDDVLARYSNELDELEDTINNTDQDKTSLAERCKTLKKEIYELREEKTACEIQVRNTLTEISELKNQIAEVETRINKNYRYLMQAEANKKAAEDANLGKAVEAILHSDIPGIHKTLAQLGKVNDEYATALETAMGNRMRCIVVDNEHVGGEAIEYLKRSRAGRATFLPLTKIRPNPIRGYLPDLNGVIDFAINLIEYDYTYENIFQFALGDTLVVDSVNTAKQLMGKYRMVTLDGSLIEKTGAMSGGSQQRSNLKFASDYDDERKEYENILRTLNEEKNELINQLKELEKKGERTRQTYSDMLNEIHKKELDLENAETSLNNIDTSAQSKVHRLEELKPKMTEAELEKTSIEEEIETLRIKVEEFRREIDDVDSSIPKEKLEKIEELTGNIEFEISNLESKLRNIDVEIEKLSNEKDFKLQSLEMQEQQIKKCKISNDKLEKDKYNARAEIMKLQNKVDELASSIATLSKELTEMQKQRDTAAKNLFDMEKSVDQSRHNIQRIEETIMAYHNRRKELASQLSVVKAELKEKNIDYSQAKDISLTTEEINKTIERLTRRMEALGPVNMLAIKEYDEVMERKTELFEKINTLSKEKEELHTRLNGYENLKKQSFMTTFENVNKNFREIYEDLSDGEGYLVLDNPEDPFKGGLTIEAKPRGKKLLRIEAMSGGEKSLTALAFVFAFQRYLPAPFYAFDEVDMFLDGINADKLAQMIREQASNAQFIVVSLRKPMIEKADRTVGVTQRKDGTSKVTGIKLHE
jgi:chromosome segregation protein